MTTLDRPAAAPQVGDFELGYYVIGKPTFIAGMTASATIFVSSSGTSSFMPVVAEMKNPKDYKKALFTCMSILNASYLAFGLVVYRWCGSWVANPSLGVRLFSCHTSGTSSAHLTTECWSDHEKGCIRCRSHRPHCQRVSLLARK